MHVLCRNSRGDKDVTATTHEGLNLLKGHAIAFHEKYLRIQLLEQGTGRDDINQNERNPSPVTRKLEFKATNYKPECVEYELFLFRF